MKFELSVADTKTVENFKRTHDCVESNSKERRGQYSYIFIPMAEGLVTQIECNLCGSLLDFTDVDVWSCNSKNKGAKFHG